MTTIGIIGAAGYTAGELLGLLAVRPDVDVRFAVSTSYAGEPIAAAHPDLVGYYEGMVFDAEMPTDETIDVLFLCTGHGRARSFLDEHAIDSSVRIIDLSSDFRLKADAAIGTRNFLYGLPELNRDRIRESRSIANPGCFATAIQLALLPLAGAGYLEDDLHINAITGSTGAGVSPSPTTHFAWRHGNVSVYKPFLHQHLAEIGETIEGIEPAWRGRFRFIPVRGPFPRGIHATVYTRTDRSEEELRDLYRARYADHPFTIVVDDPPDLKQVVNTNRCLLHVARHDDVVLVTSVIDNLLKGASGQAVQNMNLMLGLDERTGLDLKGVRF